MRVSSPCSPGSANVRLKVSRELRAYNTYLVLLLAAVPTRARVYRAYGTAGCLWSGNHGSGAEGGDEKKFVEDRHRARVWGDLCAAAVNA